MKRNRMLAISISMLFVFVSLFLTWTKSMAMATEKNLMCHDIEDMLNDHPYKSIIGMDELVTGIKTIYHCGNICTICADACIGEKDEALIRCIRLNQDCADICETTGRLLSRQTETDVNILRSQLQACVVACRDCGEECKKHAEKYKHCQICADICFQCEEDCNNLLAALPQ